MTRSLSVKTIMFAFIISTLMLLTSSVCKGSGDFTIDVLRATYAGNKWYYEKLNTNPQVSKTDSKEHVIRFCMVMDNNEQIPDAQQGDVVYFNIYHHDTNQEHSKLEWNSLDENIPVPWGFISLSTIKSYIDAQSDIRDKKAAILAKRAVEKAQAIEEARLSKRHAENKQFELDQAHRRERNAQIKSLMENTKKSAQKIIHTIGSSRQVLEANNSEFEAIMSPVLDIAQQHLSTPEFKKTKFKSGLDNSKALASQMNEISKLDIINIKLEQYTAALAAFSDALGSDKANIAKAIEAYNLALNPQPASSTSAVNGASGYESSSD